VIAALHPLLDDGHLDVASTAAAAITSANIASLTLYEHCT
jgi:hypothetical protein